MNRKQVQDFLAMIDGTYQNFNPENTTVAVNAWLLALEDYEEQEVHMAFKMYMQTSTSGFAPVPGQIIDNIHELKDSQELNEMEAWSLVRRAIKNGQDELEEFAKLPPIVQKAVGLPSQLRAWALDEHFNENVVMSNFQRAYAIELKRYKELQKMPRNIRALIEKTIKDSPAAQIEQKRQAAIETAIERKQGEIKALETKYKCSPPPVDKLEEFKRKMSN